jgi:hypothetical protein
MCSSDTWPETEARTNPSKIASARGTTGVYVSSRARSNRLRLVGGPWRSEPSATIPRSGTVDGIFQNKVLGLSIAGFEHRGFTHQLGLRSLAREQQPVRVHAVFATEIHDQVEPAVAIEIAGPFDEKVRVIDEGLR